MNNLIEPVTKDLDVQLNVPFLLYKNNQSKIYGIWFYDKEECQQIANQLLEIVESNRKHSTTSADSSLKVNTISKSNDIFRLLNNAQQSGSKNSALTSQSVKEFFEKASSSTSNSKVIFEEKKVRHICLTLTLCYNRRTIVIFNHREY